MTKKPQRHVNPDAMAFRWGLSSSYGSIRQAVRDVLATEIRAHQGNLYALSSALHIDRRALHRLITEDAYLSRVRLGAAKGRDQNQRSAGRLPRDLEE